MQLLDLLNKSVAEKRDIYVISEDNIQKIEYQIESNCEYSRLLYIDDTDNWDVADLTSIWFSIHDYCEISIREVVEKLGFL